MCKKSSFPLVFNVFLAFFITLTVTIYTLAVNQNLSVLLLVINMIPGFCLNLTLETLIDLPAFGNIFVKLSRLKMEGAAAYFVRIFFIVALLVILMSFLLMFCDLAPVLGTAFLGVWVMQLPGIFVVAYITALIVFLPSMKASQALCCKE